MDNKLVTCTYEGVAASTVQLAVTQTGEKSVYANSVNNLNVVQPIIIADIRTCIQLQNVIK